MDWWGLMGCWCQSTRTPKTWVFQGYCFHHHFQCECSARQHFLNSPWWIAGFEVPLLGQLNFESGWQWGYWLATWTLIGCDSSTFAGMFIIVWWLNCRIQWFNMFHAMNGGPFLSPIFCLFGRQNMDHSYRWSNDPNLDLHWEGQIHQVSVPSMWHFIHFLHPNDHQLSRTAVKSMIPSDILQWNRSTFHPDHMIIPMDSWFYPSPFHWIGLVGKMFTRKHWCFYMFPPFFLVFPVQIGSLKIP